MTEEFTVEQEEAMALLDSLRGQYIIAQALHYGIQELEKIPVPYQETSNLNDMKVLRDGLFSFPVEIFDNSKAIEIANQELPQYSDQELVKREIKESLIEYVYWGFCE